MWGKGAISNAKLPFLDILYDFLYLIRWSGYWLRDVISYAIQKKISKSHNLSHHQLPSSDIIHKQMTKNSIFHKFRSRSNPSPTLHTLFDHVKFGGLDGDEDQR